MMTLGHEMNSSENMAELQSLTNPPNLPKNSLDNSIYLEFWFNKLTLSIGSDTVLCSILSSSHDPISTLETTVKVCFTITYLLSQLLRVWKI